MPRCCSSSWLGGCAACLLEEFALVLGEGIVTAQLHNDREKQELQRGYYKKKKKKKKCVFKEMPN